MPKSMKRNAGNASFARGDGDAAAERPASDRAVAGLVGKKPALVPVGRPELAQVVQNRPRQGNDPLFVTLTDYPQQTIDVVDGRNLKASSLSSTQAASVDERRAGFVDWVPQARKEFADLGIAEQVGKPLLLGLADLFLKTGPDRG